MFSVLQSPYTIEPMGSVFCEPMFLAPEPKKRRCHHGSMSHQVRNLAKKHHSTVPIKYEVEETERGYVLSLYRRLDQNALRQEVNKQIAALKEQLYKPTYHYCQFLGGLVEEQADEDSLLRQAMSQLDVGAVCRKLARNAFKDYKIELNYRGDELTIVSRSDNVAKEFNLGTHIDDLEIIGCRLDKSCNNAVWRILLVGSDKVAGQVMQVLPEQTPNRERQTPFEIEQAQTQEDPEDEDWEHESHTQPEAEVTQEQEQEGHEREYEPDQTKAQQHYREESESQMESESENSDSEQESDAQEESEETEEPEASMEESKVQQPENMVDDSRSARSKIEIRFHDSEPSTKECHLSRRNSPIMEEVEDEEVDRFRQLVRRAPTGSAILEDC